MTPVPHGRAKSQLDPTTKAVPEPLHLITGKKRGLKTTETAHAMSEIADEEAYLSLAPEGPAFTADVDSTSAEVVAHRSAVSRAAKRTLDVLGAVVLAVVFVPLILAVTVFLRRSGAPVIYRHRRIGLDGRFFDCLKFRTMVPDADRVLHSLLEQDDRLKAEWIQDHKLRHDPRVTRLGRFLRRTSLDELPQLWNVIRGDMSLVGPRPVVREELLRYGRAASLYLSVKPGVTGLWQAMGRNDTDYRRRVAMDVYYVRNQSLIFDCYILLRTTGVVLAGNGAY